MRPLASIIYDALKSGRFPMAQSRTSPRVHLLEPGMRAILPLRGFHVPARLKRRIKQQPYEIRINTDFASVMRACAQRETSWINGAIFSSYCELHQRGHAHSIECWRGERLTGGLYGVAANGAFFGESMFSRERDASKIALVYLAARLIAGGFLLLDAQFMTSHLRQFGAVEISAPAFRALLHRAHKITADFHLLPAAAAPESVIHLTGQTS